MLEVVCRKFPLSEKSEILPSIHERIDKLTAHLNFKYIRPRTDSLRSHYIEPTVSATELINVGLNEYSAQNFYNHLVGGSATVGFNVNVLSPGSALKYYEIRGEGMQYFILKDEFVVDNGFVIPRFIDASEIIKFFTAWDPEALAALNTRHHYAGSVEEMLKYFENRTKTTLSDDQVYKSLAQLRTRLSDYIMTAKDSENFLRQSFTRWVTYLVEQDPSQLVKLAEMLKANHYFAGVDDIFKTRFYGALDMPSGVSLRVPLVAKPDAYQVYNRATMQLIAPTE